MVRFNGAGREKKWSIRVYPQSSSFSQLELKPSHPATLLIYFRIPNVYHHQTHGSIIDRAGGLEMSCLFRRLVYAFYSYYLTKQLGT